MTGTTRPRRDHTAIAVALLAGLQACAREAGPLPQREVAAPSTQPADGSRRSAGLDLELVCAGWPDRDVCRREAALGRVRPRPPRGERPKSCPDWYGGDLSEGEPVLVIVVADHRAWIGSAQVELERAAIARALASVWSPTPDGDDPPSVGIVADAGTTAGEMQPLLVELERWVPSLSTPRVVRALITGADGAVNSHGFELVFGPSPRGEPPPAPAAGARVDPELFARSAGGPSFRLGDYPERIVSVEREGVRVRMDRDPHAPLKARTLGTFERIDRADALRDETYRDDTAVLAEPDVEWARVVEVLLASSGCRSVALTDRAPPQ